VLIRDDFEAPKVKNCINRENRNKAQFIGLASSSTMTAAPVADAENWKSCFF
jgi:hypothetical protein